MSVEAFTLRSNTAIELEMPADNAKGRCYVGDCKTKVLVCLDWLPECVRLVS